jgi:hypothetical protein
VEAVKPSKRKGCAVCAASHLGHFGNGVLLRDSTAGLELCAAGSSGPEWDALYRCPSCGSYRRAGVVEASKDYHDVWLPIDGASDLVEFREYLETKSRAEGITEEELVARIVEASVWGL